MLYYLEFEEERWLLGRINDFLLFILNCNMCKIQYSQLRCFYFDLYIANSLCCKHECEALEKGSLQGFLLLNY